MLEKRQPGKELINIKEPTLFCSRRGPCRKDECIFHGGGTYTVVTKEGRSRLHFSNVVCTNISRPTCSSYNVILSLVHQEVGSTFPLLESGWACDYRRDSI